MKKIRIRDRDGRWLHSNRDTNIPEWRENSGSGGWFEAYEEGDAIPQPPPPPEPPPLVEITRGGWNANFLFGPQDSYFSPACINFDDDRFQRILDWNVQRGYTHLVINALAQDHWGADRGRPHWTIRRHRWNENANSRKLTKDRLIATRAAGLQPIVGLFEHTDLPISVDDAIVEAQAAVDFVGEHISALIMCWETDERIPNSDARMTFEETLLSRVDWKGIDVGIHYSQVKRLEGSGLDVSERWNRAHPGHVAKFYQSRRNAPISEIREESRILAEVAAARGIKLAAFEHSGTDPAIGQVVSEAEANRRAQACIDEMRVRLPIGRTGSMNGKVSL